MQVNADGASFDAAAVAEDVLAIIEPAIPGASGSESQVRTQVEQYCDDLREADSDFERARAVARMNGARDAGDARDHCADELREVASFAAYPTEPIDGPLRPGVEDLTCSQEAVTGTVATHEAMTVGFVVSLDGEEVGEVLFTNVMGTEQFNYDVPAGTSYDECRVSSAFAVRQE